MGVSALTRLPGSTNVERLIEVLKRDGGVIVEDMIDPTKVDLLMADLEPSIEARRATAPDGDASGRVGALIARSVHALDFVTQQLFLRAAETLLGQPFPFRWGDATTLLQSSIQISLTQAMTLFPGVERQGLHRDDALWRTVHPGPDNDVQCLFAATDFTEANGATLVIPGSHIWDDVRIPRYDEAVPAVMRKGSGLIYLGSLYHAGGSNRSDRPRTAIGVQYARGFLRQEENQYLAVPRHVVRQLPKRVQALLGWAPSEPSCGCVEMKPPLDYVETGFDDAITIAPEYR